MPIRLAVAVLAATLLACQGSEGGGTGTVHLALAQPSAAVAAIAYAVTCDDGASWSAYVDMEEEGLPGHVSADHEGWPFADLFFVTGATSCQVQATAMDAPGEPAASCEPASATIAVTPDVTTEALLVITCAGDPGGGADLVVLINQAPVVEVISVAPALEVPSCELVRVTPTVSDADGDDVELGFVVDGPAGGQLAAEEVLAGELSFAPATAGVWSVTVVASDPWTTTEAAVEITVLADDTSCAPAP